MFAKSRFPENDCVSLEGSGVGSERQLDASNLTVRRPHPIVGSVPWADIRFQQSAGQRPPVFRQLGEVFRSTKVRRPSDGIIGARGRPDHPRREQGKAQSIFRSARIAVLGSTEPARASIDQPLQLNWCNVPESPCHWRSFGSDHRLPLLLAKSMLAN